MKRFIILLAFAIAATSCAVLQPKARREIVDFVDFRPYTSAGFLITPDQYPGKYEAIGQLEIRIYPEQLTDGIYYTTEEISTSELLEIAFKNSVGKGANGLTNFKIERVALTSYSKYGSTTTLSHYVISGFLIRTTD